MCGSGVGDGIARTVRHAEQTWFDGEGGKHAGEPGVGVPAY